MNISLIIVDDFYQDPDSVRNYALSQEFSVRGNFPGCRTAPYLPDDVKLAISHHMQFAGGVTNWCMDSGYSGAFQLTTAGDRSWIHSDYYNMWAAVCYLTPHAPHSGGTGFFRHRATGEHLRSLHDHEGQDYTKWDLFDVVGNKYNRLVIYRADLFHTSLDYFGSTPQDGRLFQTFFFDTARH
jgi:hypothetical protein